MKTQSEYDEIDERLYWRIVLWAVVAAVLMVASLLLSSCATAKRCARLFPAQERVVTTTELVPGETVYKFDTVTADCDEVLTRWALQYGMGEQAKQTIAKGAARVRVPCPPSEHRVDTARTTRTITIVNTAERDAYKADAERLRRGRNTWRWIGGSFIALLLGAVVWKVLSWKVSKFL